MKTKYTLKIERDEFSESPDQWKDENIFLVYDHPQFDVRRKGFSPRDIFVHLNAKKLISEIETIKDSLENEGQLDHLNEEYDKYWIFVVDAYIHSGVALSLAGGRYFPDRKWDVSTTGYVLVSKQEWKIEDEAKNAANCLIDTWNQYISGDVWGYQVVEETTCECCHHTSEKFVDSCWGFYRMEDCEEQGKFALDGFNNRVEV